MANKLINMEVIRQIIQLATQGYSMRKISDQTGVHRKAVNKYLAKAKHSGHGFVDLLSFTDEALSLVLLDTTAKSVIAQRRAVFERLIPFFESELKRVGVTKQLLHRDYLTQNPDGYGRSQFCDLLSAYQRRKDVSMVQPCYASELMQVDFAGKTLYWFDPDTGEKIDGEVFIATLPFSGMTYVQVLRSQKQEEFADAIQQALEYLGGVPKTLKTDNLKSGVIKSDRYEPTFNKLLLELCNHYKMGLDAARVYKPKDKPHVERHVALVYQRIYAPLRNEIFYSAEQINQAIRPLLDTHHSLCYRGESTSRKELFDAEEKPLLASLPDTRFAVKYRRTVLVQKHYHLWLTHIDGKGRYYSVPYQYVGKKVQVVYDLNSLEVYFDFKRIASHIIAPNAKRYNTIKEHMPLSHQKVAGGMDPEQLISEAARIGSSTEQVIREILNRGQHCQQHFKSCQGVLSTAKKYSEQRLESACQRALLYNSIGYKVIVNILEKGLDKDFDQQQIGQVLPNNPTARGASAYQS
jgi:transposase